MACRWGLGGFKFETIMARSGGVLIGPHRLRRGTLRGSRYRLCSLPVDENVAGVGTCNRVRARKKEKENVTGGLWCGAALPEARKKLGLGGHGSGLRQTEQNSTGTAVE